MKQDELLNICNTIQILLATDCRDKDFARQWCAVQEGKGCRKSRECRKASSGRMPSRCWSSRPANAWCPKLRGVEEADRKRPNPTAILGPACAECAERGQYRDCEPCPYYGCLLGADVEKDDDDTLCPFAWCYSSRDDLSNPRPNPFRFLQCFVTRPDFRKFQRSTLRLVAASYLYKDINDESHPTYYLMKNPIACLQFLSTHISHAGKRWEPFEDEQVRWHAIASARRERLGASLFDLLAGKGRERCSPLEQELGVVCVEDGEFSAFLLRWMLVRMLVKQGGRLPALQQRVAIPLREEEKVLIDDLTKIGLAAPRPRIKDDRILTSVLDVFQDLGLIDRSARPTTRMASLTQWLNDLSYAASRSRLLGRRRLAEEPRPDMVPARQHASILFGPPARAQAARERRQQLRHVVRWAKARRPDHDYQHIRELVSLLGRCDGNSLNNDTLVAGVEKASRFPLAAHYQVRQGFDTPLMWIVFSVLCYRTDPHMMVLEPETAVRRPIGLFIGLQHQDSSRPMKRVSFRVAVARLRTVGTLLAVATNHDFLNTVLQKYVALSGTAFAGLAAAHVIRNMSPDPLSLESVPDLDLRGAIEQARERAKADWARVLGIADALLSLGFAKSNRGAEPFDLRQMIDSLVKAKQPQLAPMGVRLEVHGPASCPVRGNEEAIRIFVVEELLANAIGECEYLIEHGDQGDSSASHSCKRETSALCISLSLHLQSSNNMAFFVIVNHTHSVSEDEKRRIGHPRYRNREWRGVGLPVARLVTRHFGGDLIWNPDDVQRTFTVTMSLPRHQPKGQVFP